MKIAVRKWVRSKELKVTHIHRCEELHPEHIRNYCAGCRSLLAGKPFAIVWAVNSDGFGGGYMLCASCTTEAQTELEARISDESDITPERDEYEIERTSL